MSDFEGGSNTTPETGSFILEQFFTAIRVEEEYRDGTRQVDSGWVSTLFNDPEKGDLLEGILRDQVGTGRRDSTQESEVENEVRSIIASLLDPAVVLTPYLASKRDHFLQFLDLIKPDSQA